MISIKYLIILISLILFMSKEFTLKIKIYYEDTDAGGVVYYANYLKFMERARSEAIYSMGLSNKTIFEDYKILLIVKSCNIQYIKSAKLEDELKIITSIKSISKTSFIMKQITKRFEELIADAEVHLVSVNKDGKPTKIPEVLENNLKKYIF